MTKELVMIWLPYMQSMKNIKEGINYIAATFSIWPFLILLPYQNPNISYYTHTFIEDINYWGANLNVYTKLINGRIEVVNKKSSTNIVN